jgi:hypothetical protein
MPKTKQLKEETAIYKVIAPLTVQEILDEQIAMKLA